MRLIFLIFLQSQIGFLICVLTFMLLFLSNENRLPCSDSNQFYLNGLQTLIMMARLLFLACHERHFILLILFLEAKLALLTSNGLYFTNLINESLTSVVVTHFYKILGVPSMFFHPLQRSMKKIGLEESP